MRIRLLLLISMILVNQLGIATQRSYLTATSLKKEEVLRDASIQILLYPENRQDSPEIGLGTLVAASGHVYIITHNHWNTIQHWDKIQFRNAQSEPLLELHGRDFQALIVYQDPGNLILLSPLPKDLPSVRFGSSRSVKPGDTVTVAFQDPNKGNNIGTLSAQVKEVGKEENMPVFLLAEINGEDVDPYDAGGGIWFDGGLVGNLWKVIPYTPGFHKVSQIQGFRQEMIGAFSTADFLRRRVI